MSIQEESPRNVEKTKQIEQLQRVFVISKVKDMMVTYFDAANDYVNNDPSLSHRRVT